MTEFIINFETAIGKALKGKPKNDVFVLRALLYILAPILRLPTINALCSALNTP